MLIKYFVAYHTCFQGTMLPKGEGNAWVFSWRRQRFFSRGSIIIVPGVTVQLLRGEVEVGGPGGGFLGGEAAGLLARVIGPEGLGRGGSTARSPARPKVTLAG
jgi:hypothetical protein